MSPWMRLASVPRVFRISVEGGVARYAEVKGQGGTGAAASGAEETAGAARGAGRAAGEGGPASEELASTAERLTREINRALRAADLAPLAQLLTLPVMGAIVYGALVAKLPFAVLAAIGGIGVACVGAVFALLRQADAARKTVTLVYALDPEAAEEFSRVRQAFSEFAACRGVWHVVRQQRAPEPAAHVGAVVPPRRYRMRPELAPPPRVRCNVVTPALYAGRRSLYFMPDRVLVVTGKHASAVDYATLEASAGVGHFMEDGDVPSDARVVGSTWRHVHPDGTADLRFRDNRQLPIAVYGELRLSGAAGLDESFLCSRPEASKRFAEAVVFAATGAWSDEEDEGASEGGAAGASAGDGRDPLYDEALVAVASAGYASSTLLAQRLRIGHERASSILDMMEREGYVDPARGTEPRTVKESARRYAELLARLGREGAAGEGERDRSSSSWRSSSSSSRSSSSRRASSRGRARGAPAAGNGPRSPFLVLGLDEGASPEEAAAAYHRLAQMYHPDKVANLAPEFQEIAESRMKEINAAYREIARAGADGRA